MITLHKLSLFLTVIEHGSFNGAADALLMSQSVVSGHIGDLEAAFGTPLFRRSARGVQPTPAGERLIDYAERILALVAEAEREVARVDLAAGGRLAVSATPGVSVYLLPAWLQRLQAVHPAINVSLQTVLTGEVIAGVRSGRDQFGFLEGELEELDQEGLSKQGVREIEYVVTVPAGHPWANETAIAPESLVGVPFINRQPTSRTRRWLDRTLGARGIRLRSVAELDSLGAIKFALFSGMGVAILPGYAIEREVERGELIALRLDGLPLVRPLLLVWDGRRAFSALQRAFLRVVVDDQAV